MLLKQLGRISLLGDESVLARSVKSSYTVDTEIFDAFCIGLKKHWVSLVCLLFTFVFWLSFCSCYFFSVFNILYNFLGGSILPFQRNLLWFYVLILSVTLKKEKEKQILDFEVL